MEQKKKKIHKGTGCAFGFHKRMNYCEAIVGLELSMYGMRYAENARLAKAHPWDRWDAADDPDQKGSAEASSKEGKVVFLKL